MSRMEVLLALEIPRDVRFCVFHGNMEFAQHTPHEVKNSSYDIGATGSWSLKLDILAQSSKVGNLSGQLWVLGLEPLWLFLKVDLFQGAK